LPGIRVSMGREISPPECIGALAILKATTGNPTQ
jgi:hypothetical protein